MTAQTTSAEDRAAQLKATIDGTIERLVEQLKEGHTEEYRRMLRFWSHFHRYSHGNVILMLSQRPDATQVAGYRTWQKLGRQVRQGARAISIWCPLLATIEDPDTHLPVEICTGFKPCPVFAAEDLVDIQTNPLPSLWRQLPDDAEGTWQYCVAKVIAAGYPLKIVPLRPGAQGGSSKDGRILIAPGLDSRNRVFVLLHELAHQLEHFREERKDAILPQRELEAESAAMIVAAMFGLEHPSARDYILSYQGDADGLKASLATIRRIVGQMVKLLGLDHRHPPETAAAVASISGTTGEGSSLPSFLIQVHQTLLFLCACSPHCEAVWSGVSAGERRCVAACNRKRLTPICCEPTPGDSSIAGMSS
jgi:hypothetical protein